MSTRSRHILLKGISAFKLYVELWSKGFASLKSLERISSHRAEVPLSADLVILDANILTLEEDGSAAEAVAVKDGRIIYVGSSEGAKDLIGRETKVIDAEGKTVVPGLIDAHMHPIMFGFSMMQLKLRDVGSVAELKMKVAEKVGEIPQGGWILGRGWDQERFVEGRHPTRWDLDDVAPDNPILLDRVCGHICIANTKALELAGITKATPDPEGGRIDRDPSTGEPTGILRERARELAWRAVPEAAPEDYVKAAEMAFQEAVRHGLTCIHFVSATPHELRVLQEMRRDGRLKVRIRLFIQAEFLDELIKLGIRRGFGDDFLRINGVKVFTDGSLGARTAAMRRPYTDDPGNSGILIYTQAQLDEIVEKAHAADLQLAIHAIGDRGIEMALKAVGKALLKRPVKDHRHRIEHASVLAPDLIAKMSELGVTAAVQPRFVISDFWAVSRVGPDRARWVYPFKTLMKEGVKVSGGSDCPVDPLDPLYQMYSAIKRGESEGIELFKHSSHEALTPLEALRIFTKDAAYAGFDEGLLGTIRVGGAADLVVLSGNPLGPDKIPGISVLATIIDGKIAYASKALRIE